MLRFFLSSEFQPPAALQWFIYAQEAVQVLLQPLPWLVLSLYLSLFAAVGVEAQLTVGLALAQRLAQQLHQPLLPDELQLVQQRHLFLPGNTTGSASPSGTLSASARASVFAYIAAARRPAVPARRSDSVSPSRSDRGKDGESAYSAVTGLLLQHSATGCCAFKPLERETGGGRGARASERAWGGGA